MKSEDEVLLGYVSDLHKVADQVGMSTWEQDFIFDQTRFTTFKHASQKVKSKIIELAEKYGV